MEAEQDRVVSLPAEAGPAEERMLRVDLVREIVARKSAAKGEADCARTRDRSQDSEALAQMRGLATAESSGNCLVRSTGLPILFSLRFDSNTATRSTLPAKSLCEITIEV